jgi:hypothetical protein
MVASDFDDQSSQWGAKFPDYGNYSQSNFGLTVMQRQQTRVFEANLQNGGIEPQPAPGQILPLPTSGPNYSREPDVNSKAAPIRPAKMVTRKI